MSERKKNEGQKTLTNTSYDDLLHFTSTLVENNSEELTPKGQAIGMIIAAIALIREAAELDTDFAPYAPQIEQLIKNAITMVAEATIARSQKIPTA